MSNKSISLDKTSISIGLLIVVVSVVSFVVNVAAQTQQNAKDIQAIQVQQEKDFQEVKQLIQSLDENLQTTNSSVTRLNALLENN